MAELIESLAAMAPERTPAPRSLSAAGRRQALAHSRTCYDHLAGTVGVAITDAMLERRLLDLEHGLGLTSAGATWLQELGITVPTGTRRPSVRSCLDWTEHRPHLAGAVGAALCRHAFGAGWITPVGTTRAVAVTPLGRQALRRHLGCPTDSFDPVVTEIRMLDRDPYCVQTRGLENCDASAERSSAP